MQFTKFVLPNLYFGVLNCENKFHKNLFCNEFFLQGNPRRIFIYSIYIFICSIYILNYILYIIYIYTYIIYIYITKKENTIAIPGVDGFDAMNE